MPTKALVSKNIAPADQASSRHKSKEMLFRLDGSLYGWRTAESVRRELDEILVNKLDKNKKQLVRGIEGCRWCGTNVRAVLPFISIEERQAARIFGTEEAQCWCVEGHGPAKRSSLSEFRRLVFFFDAGASFEEG